MSPRRERDQEPFDYFYDRCRGEDPHTHCGVEISHHYRTKPLDPRVVYTREKPAPEVYTAANRPKYHRCYRCAAKMHAKVGQKAPLFPVGPEKSEDRSRSTSEKTDPYPYFR
jgi:hypothetical protein